MSADEGRWAELKRIHAALIDAPPDVRAARLQELAGHDPELLEEARALLDACDQADDVLPVPEQETVGEWFGVARTEPRRTLRRLGPFHIVRELAQGGMGIVFEALQDEPKRRVALKVLRAGLDSEAARLRFEQEARVLGNLTHPGIATLHGVGQHEAATGEHLPYLVMELVAGARPITTYARDEDLDERERLELFLGALAAVAAGHQRGIIHRDLKPDNVLVDEDGRTKVIDFGIARVTAADIDRGQVTKTGLVMGTLGYIAPEQLKPGGAGDDVRMDVYALGVILYELLTGRQPLELDGRDPLEAVRITLEQRPTPPTRHVPDMAQDLVLILGKALAKDPAERYDSVEALGRDIEAYLNSEPIRARPPSWTYQVRLFTRRHRVGVLSAALVLATLAGATWWSLHAASIARESARRERASSDRAQAMLLESQSLVHGLVDGLYKDLDRLPGTLPVRMTLVRRLEQGAEALRVRAGDDERLLRTAALVHHHVSMLNFRYTGDHLGRPDAALEANARAREALALLRAASEAPDPAQAREDEHLLAILIGDRADLLEHAGETKAAREADADAVARLEALHAAWPDDLAVVNSLASRHLRFARKEHLGGDDEGALRRVEAALALLPTEPPGDAATAAKIHGNRGFLASFAGRVLRQQGRLEEAAPRLEAALRAFEAQRALDEGTQGIRLHLAVAYGELGLLAMAEGAPARGVEHLTEAIRLGREQVARNPADRQAREALYVDMSSMARAQAALGDLDKAIAWQRQSVEGGAELVEQQPGALFPRVEQRIGLNQLGGYHFRAGRLAEAVKAYEEAFALAEAFIAEHPDDVSARLGWAEALDSLGIARWSQSQDKPKAERRRLLVEAKDLFTRSLAVHEAMARDGVVPSTHEGASALVRNKVRICTENLATLDGTSAPK